MSDVVTGAAEAAPASPAIAPAQTVDTPAVHTDPMDRIDQTMREHYDKINPPRENGKFVAKDKPAEGAEAPADTEIKDQNPAEVVTEPPKVAAIDPPVSWSAEKKALWPTLSPDAQSYIAQREGEAHKRISELGQQVKAHEPYRQIEEHFSDVLRKNNLRGPDAVARAMAVARMFDENPENAISELSKAYGVNLSGSQSPSQEPGQESGEVRALKSEIASLKRMVGETASKVTAREQAEHQQTQAALDKLVADFSKDKTDLAEIEGDFVAHISAIRSAEPDLAHEKVLEKAYEAARWANPNTRTKLLAEQEKQRAEKADAEQKKKAAEAKKVGSLNVKSTSASPAKKGSWEDTLQEVGERIA
jgi:hypothetical protein